MKAQIRDLSSAIGAVVGGVVGNSASNAQIGGVIGQNAVENNAVSDIADALAAGKKPEQQAKERTQELRLQGCAAAGLVGEACSVELRRQGYEIAQETAGILLPTTIYEVVPIGKGVGLAIKGTKKLVAIYKDSKTAKNAAEKAGAKVDIGNPTGLVGTDFEKWLKVKYEGQGSFSKGGREFDGSIGNTNRWFEAKSGNYWKDQTQTVEKLAKFKSDMGARKSIAERNGATYELHSNTPIPEDIKKWLTGKGIPFFEHN